MVKSGLNRLEKALILASFVGMLVAPITYVCTKNTKPMEEITMASTLTFLSGTIPYTIRTRKDNYQENN